MANTAHHAPSSLAGAAFTALPFVKPVRDGVTRYWSPPPASSYEEASDMGRTCAVQLARWLQQNADGAAGQALVIWVVSAMFEQKATPISRGYRAGFLSQIAGAVAGQTTTGVAS